MTRSDHHHQHLASYVGQGEGESSEGPSRQQNPVMRFPPERGSHNCLLSRFIHICHSCDTTLGRLEVLLDSDQVLRQSSECLTCVPLRPPEGWWVATRGGGLLLQVIEPVGGPPEESLVRYFSFNLSQSHKQFPFPYGL